MIDKLTLTQIQARMALKLRELEQELGIAIEPWGGQYGKADGSAVAKFSFRRVGAAAAPAASTSTIPMMPSTSPGDSKMNFEARCRLYGFEPSDYKRRLSHRGTLYELIAFNPGAHKNVCTIRRVSDGKEFRGSADLVKMGFSLAPKVAA